MTASVAHSGEEHSMDRNSSGHGGADRVNPSEPTSLRSEQPRAFSRSPMHHRKRTPDLIPIGSYLKYMHDVTVAEDATKQNSILVLHDSPSKQLANQSYIHIYSYIFIYSYLDAAPLELLLTVAGTCLICRDQLPSQAFDNMI